MTQESATGHAKATIWAAIIGSIGVVVAAVVGVTFSRNKGADERIDLPKQADVRNQKTSMLEVSNANPTPPLNQSAVPAPSNHDGVTHLTVDAMFLGPVIASDVKEGIQFDLYGCVSASGTLTCGLKVVSPIQDREFMLAVRQEGGIRRTNVEFTRGVDSEGNIFISSGVSVGNKTNPRFKIEVRHRRDDYNGERSVDLVFRAVS